jgi:hypothetical protein
VSVESKIKPSSLNLSRLALGWVAGTGAAYFLTSFFSNFYSGTDRFILLGLGLNVLCAAAAAWIVDEAWTRLRSGWRTEWPGLLVLLLASFLTMGAVRVSMGFPGLFDSRLLFMENSRLPLFIGLSVLSFPLTYFLLRRVREQRLPASFVKFARENFSGLLLAAFFFATYFTFAETVNFPGHRTLDEYFDMDVSAWLARLSASSAQEITDVVRAVHPAVLLFLRPLVWFISLFLNGNRLHAVFVLHALVAASCVFLMWRIVKRASGRTTYALAMASLLGVSASHLLLGSMLETYIYSALALLIFVSILQNEKVSLWSTIPAGVLVFGITVTNLAQAVVLYFIKQPRLKVIINFLLLVVGLTLLLNVLQVWIYPAATLVTPSNLKNERSYQFDLFESTWRRNGRISLEARAVTSYGIVAPSPYVLTEELGVPYPNFRTFKITTGEFHVAGYAGLADVTARLWMLALAAAIIFFIARFLATTKLGVIARRVLVPTKQSPLQETASQQTLAVTIPDSRSTLALSLLMCIGFNLALHIIYGDDPMLYSPDWTYALVLFVALAFAQFADRKWFQIASVIFLALLMVVNVGLLRQIMEVSAPFYGK